MGAAELLGPSGPFALGLPGYEARAGQLEMARAVERCLNREGIAMIEAGTGTGKTLAYLVPALLAASTKKIVISTATRALQDQIFHRDLPLCDRVLGTHTPVALMKGLPNYLCRRRYHEFSGSAESFEPEWSDALGLVDEWLAQTKTGAIEELAALAEDAPIWPRLTASSERRIGATCRFFESCHVTAMKREALRARVVVVNHHLFFADLALRGSHPGSVIPDYDAVIFDEAHQLEEIATLHFGVSVSSARVARLCNDAAPLLERELGPSGADHTRRIQVSCEEFYAAVGRAVRSADGRAPLSPEVWAGDVESHWFALDTALEGLGGRIDAVQTRRGEDPDGDVFADSPRQGLEALGRRANELREDLASIARGAPGAVVWFESAGRSRKLSASPVNLAELFQTRLFDVVPSIVLTSATLSNGPSEPSEAESEVADRAGRAQEREPGARHVELDADEPLSDAAPKPAAAKGPFRFQRQRLGLDAALYRVEELRVASPFNFEQQAVLYLPLDLPLPDDPGFILAAAERSCQLIEQSDGGAFVLTTSLRAMHGLHRALAERLGARPLLLQGQAPKAVLLERFRSAHDAVLVATLSFWQGVDIPGAALRLVVLEKAPFPVPSDPIVSARSRALTEAGESAFTRLHLPLAQLTLKQGFGRLIRSQSDYGVVALLDARVHRRGYGRRLLEGLPPARRVSELAEVAAFWLARRPTPERRPISERPPSTIPSV